MGIKEDKNHKNRNKRNTKQADVIAARAALLDYYGDGALSFSNQFIASIFGLVASSAIIQSVLVFLLSENEPLRSETVLFFILSLAIFVGFSYMARYTFNKFSYYSGLASNLTIGKDGILESARLTEVYIYYENKTFLRERGKLEETYKWLVNDKQLVEGTKWFHEFKRGNKTVYTVNHIVHTNYNYRKSQKIWWRRRFKGLMIFALFLLAVVTYYPLIAELIRIYL